MLDGQQIRYLSQTGWLANYHGNTPSIVDPLPSIQSQLLRPISILQGLSQRHPGSEPGTRPQERVQQQSCGLASGAAGLRKA
jgi:hypothetical protein